MDTYCVFWLMDELKVLCEKHIITEETAQKIAAYYRPHQEQAAALAVPETPRAQHSRSVTIIPVLLAAIAAVLIAAGIISLIAYNWNALPRSLKATAAFVLLLVLQAGGLAVFCKEKLSSRPALREGTTALREGAALLWALLFGGVTAFISQICRLPGDAAAFVLVWAVSSILVMYAMQSAGVFVLTLVLSAAYTMVCRTAHGAVSPTGEASLFYLLFVFLWPFARRFRYGIPAMLALAAAMLGVVLEKAVPGLWIICSVSFAVLCLEYGMDSGSKLVKYAAAAGLCFLLQSLSLADLWQHVGWHYLRDGHSSLGTVLDCLLALSLTAAAALWQLVPLLRKKAKPSFRLVYPLCALVVAALYLCYALSPEGAGWQRYLAPTVMLFLFSALFIIQLLYSRLSFAVFTLYFLCSSACLAKVHFPVVAIALCVLFVEAAGRYRSVRSEEEGRWIYAALRVLAAIVLFSLGFANGGLYAIASRGALAMQLVLYGSLAAAAAAFFVCSRRWKESLDLAALCLVTVLWTWGAEHGAKFMAGVPLAVALCAGLYGFVCWRYRKRKAFVPYIALFVMQYMSVAGRFLSPALLVGTFFLISAAVYFYGKEKGVGKENPASLVGGVFAAAFILVIAVLGRDLTDYPRFGEDAVSIACAFVPSVVFWGYMVLAPAVTLLRQRRNCNYAFALYALAVCIWQLVSFARTLLSGYEKAMLFFSFASVFLVAGCALFEAYRESSLAKANVAAVYAALVLIIKFFSDDYSFAAKGVLFIVLGIAMLLLNIFLARTKKEELHADVR